eukprot:jgi/Chlat1/6810/Chrsp51S06509
MGNCCGSDGGAASQRQAAAAADAFPPPAVPLLPEERLRIEVTYWLGYSCHSQTDYVGTPTQKTTSLFEVEIVKKDGTRELIFSKKNGEGYFNTSTKSKRVLDAVEATLLQEQSDIKPPASPPGGSE